MYLIESTAYPSILADANDVILLVSLTSDYYVHGKMAFSLKTVFILYIYVKYLYRVNSSI